MSLTSFAYKMRATLKEEGLLCLSLPMPCWQINEETHLPIGVHIQKPLQLKGETCPPRTDHKGKPSFT